MKGLRVEPEAFLEAYAIDELKLSKDADIREREITRVDVAFGGGAGDDSRPYAVVFKLLDQSADSHRYIRRIGPPPACALELTAEGQALGDNERGERLRELLQAIAGRVDKVHKEQSILNIQPLGKSFLLMGKTRFEVLADDGQGQLSILIHRPEGRSEAGLNANDLLDGLYSGLITRL